MERKYSFTEKLKIFGLETLVKLDQIQIPVGVALIGLGIFVPSLIPIGIFMAGGSAITLPIEKRALENAKNPRLQIPQRRIPQRVSQMA